MTHVDHHLGSDMVYGGRDIVGYFKEFLNYMFLLLSMQVKNNYDSLFEILPPSIVMILLIKRGIDSVQTNFITVFNMSQRDSGNNTLGLGILYFLCFFFAFFA